MHKSLFSSMMILGIFAYTLLDRLAWKKKKEKRKAYDKQCEEKDCIIKSYDYLK